MRRTLHHVNGTKPVVVEKVKRRAAPGDKPAPSCPACGTKMKLVRGAAEPWGTPKLTASCPRCFVMLPL